MLIPLFLLHCLQFMKQRDTCGLPFVMLTCHGRDKLKPVSGFRSACHQLDGGDGLGWAGRVSELDAAS